MNTQTTPTRRLDPKVTTAWRIQSAIGLVMLCLAVLVVGSGLAFFVEIIPPTLAVLAFLGAVAASIVYLIVVPEIRYRRWRWEVTETEIRLQSGLIVVQLTVIPMVRVQHVDTSQGPVLRPFGLSEVHVWTAAKSHVIPALADSEATELRDRIAVLARVSDDGGL